MQSLTSSQEAKEHLIARIVLEAEREGVPLSETERKMMYFTETAPTLPELQQVNEDFEQDYDQQTYEDKVAKLARKAWIREAKLGASEDWKAAVRILRSEDHYLLVLLGSTTESPVSPLTDRVRLIATALLISLALIAGVYFFSTKR